MDILDAIFLRAPCREFTGEPIPDELLEAILEAARWTPSAMNVHNHRTVVVRDPGVKERLARNAEEARRTAHATHRFVPWGGEWMSRLWWVPAEARPGMVEGARAHASSPARADVLLLAFMNPNWFDTLSVVYEAIGTVTTAKALMNLWTAATALGVGGSLHMSGLGDPRRQTALLDDLGVPRDWRLLGVLALGMPKRRFSVRPPKPPLESIVFDDYWGRPWRRVAFRTFGGAWKGAPRIPHVEALDGLRLRRSARGFKTGKEGHVPDWKLELLLEAARCGPSPGNLQPLRFLVIRDPETKRLIGACGKEAGRMAFGSVPWEETASRMWYVDGERHPGVLEEATSGELFAYPEQASAIILPLYSTQWTDLPITIHDPNPAIAAQAMAVQNMWNATTPLGIGMGYNGFPFIDLRKRDTILNRLGVPKGWTGNMTLNVGVPDRVRMSGPPRWPLETVAFDERWGRAYRRGAFREGAVQPAPVPSARPVPAEA